jgi:FkbM family methyltransferase
MILPSQLRRVIERYSRSLVLRRRLPVRFGGARLSVSPGAALCYFRGLDTANWTEVYDFASHCIVPGASVWDVGASMGVFAFAAAHVAGANGRVLAVEPDTWSAELIKRSAQTGIPSSARVRVACAAVGDQVSLQNFQIPERGRAGAHLEQSSGAGASLLGGTRESHPAVTVTLDWLLREDGPPAVIKIDVEGMELKALQGAIELLRSHRPMLLIETYERNADGVTALLRSNDYELFDLSSGWHRRTRVPRAVYNTLALPLVG